MKGLKKKITISCYYLTIRETMKSLRSRIQKKRNSRNLFWKLLFSGKDLLWKKLWPIYLHDIWPLLKKGPICELGMVIPVKSVVVERSFRRQIHKIYRRLGDNIVYADDKKTVITKSDNVLSKGCQCCKKGTWLNVFVGMRCNLDCVFCGGPSVNVREDEPEGYQCGMPFKAFVETILEQGDRIEGVSYSGGEPLLYLDNRVVPIAAMLQDKKTDLYQWVYTNGVLVTPDSMKKLRDSGIKEVRVDLAATDFDEGTMNKLPVIRDIIGKVTVQVPSIPEVYNKLVKEKSLLKLIDYGVELLNLQELYVRTAKATAYLKGKDVYYSRQGLLSPTESRSITAAVIKYVVENNLPILVNDCSNDAVFVWRSNLAFDQKLFRKSC